MKVLFTFLYLSLSSPNLTGSDHISCCLTIKYQLSNTLSHFCFEKMPKSLEFTHAWQALVSIKKEKKITMLSQADCICTYLCNLLSRTAESVKVKKVSLAWIRLIRRHVSFVHGEINQINMAFLSSNCN